MRDEQLDDLVEEEHRLAVLRWGPQSGGCRRADGTERPSSRTGIDSREVHGRRRGLRRMNGLHASRALEAGCSLAPPSRGGRLLKKTTSFVAGQKSNRDPKNAIPKRHSLLRDENGGHVDAIGQSYKLYRIQAYLLKNPVNFGQLILVNGARTRKKKTTIVISTSSTCLPAHKNF